MHILKCSPIICNKVYPIENISICIYIYIYNLGECFSILLLIKMDIYWLNYFLIAFFHFTFMNLLISFFYKQKSFPYLFNLYLNHIWFRPNGEDIYLTVCTANKYSIYSFSRIHRLFIKAELCWAKIASIITFY